MMHLRIWCWSLTILAWVPLVSAQTELLEGPACCIHAEQSACGVEPSLEDCLATPGAPVPGDLCCVVEDVAGLGCLGADCYTGPEGTEGVGECRSGSWGCSPEGHIACQGEVTPEEETCDGLDNDCDGMTDEGFDEDADGFTVCGGDCDDSDPGTFPGASETCDGVDNDCDGLTDEGTGGAPCDGPDGDLCQEGTFVCVGGAFTCDDTTGTNVEACDGVDNDCDGVVDEGC